jgi:hypothetical protein
MNSHKYQDMIRKRKSQVGKFNCHTIQFFKKENRFIHREISQDLGIEEFSRYYFYWIKQQPSTGHYNPKGFES